MYNLLIIKPLKSLWTQFLPIYSYSFLNFKLRYSCFPLRFKWGGWEGRKQGFLYAPFGELMYEHDPLWQNNRVPKYSFNAKELDEENGMYYYSARYYAPPTFISRDPMFEKYPSISPYTYTKNSPLNYVDQDGQRPRPYGLLLYYGLTLGGVSKVGESQTIGGYNIVPFYDRNGILLGYNAGRYINNGQDYRTEYQMESGDLADFTNNVKTYEAIANLIYCAGEPDWSSIAMTDKMINGDIVGALGELVTLWENALSDPNFYLSLATSIAGTGVNLSKTNAINKVVSSPSKTSVYFSRGKASDFYKTLNSGWKGDLVKVSDTYATNSFRTANGTRITIGTNSKSTGQPTIKIATKEHTIILRFPEY